MRPSVLQLISSSGFYGAEKVLVELACHLRAAGCGSQVGVFANRGTRGEQPLLDEAHRRGLQTVRFGCHGAFDGATMAAIRRHVQEQRVQLVHSHGYKADIYAFLGRHPAARLVATCHNWLTDSPKLLLYELLDKLVLHQFDRVVGVSPALDRELASAGIPPQRRALIENGLSAHPYDADRRDAVRRELGATEGEPVAITIGRLDPWKDHALLLEALARVRGPRPPRLVLVGDGDLRPELAAQATRLGLAGRVVLTGYRQDVGDLLHASDLFVISSNKEGLPMVLLEAMAAGVPVVSTAVGAIPSTVRDGEEALLVPPGDPGALAAAMTRVLADATLARELAARARARFEARYSREAMGARYLELYRGLLEPDPKEESDS